MANVAVAIAMAPTYLPYERPPDVIALWSAIPRGLRGFVVDFGTITAKPINDTETLSLSGTLSPNFGYVFADIAVSLRQDVATAWDSEYTLNLQSYYQGGAHGGALSMDWNFDLSLVGLLGDRRAQGHTAIDQTPRQPMWAPATSSGIQVVISMFNSAAPAGAIGNVSAYINFWEFDLEQIRNFPSTRDDE